MNDLNDMIHAYTNHAERYVVILVNWTPGSMERNMKIICTLRFTDKAY
jgi:hypothetical protein